MKKPIGDLTYFLKKNPELYRETLVEFANNRYSQASLNEIIRRSAFNKGSFYYRFQDKKALYIAILDDLYVTQYSFPETRLLLEESKFNFEEALQLLFHNMVWTSRENPLYLKLLRNFFFETAELKEVVTKECIKPLFSRFFDRLRAFLRKRGYSPDSPSLIFLIKDMEMRYFCIGDYLPAEFNFEEVDQIINDIIASAELKLGPGIWRYQFPLSSIVPTFDQHPQKAFDLRIIPGEIIALVGETDSSVSVWIKHVSDSFSNERQIRDDNGSDLPINRVFFNTNSISLPNLPPPIDHPLRTFLSGQNSRRKLTKIQEKMCWESGLYGLLEVKFQKLTPSERVMAFLVKGLLTRPDLIVGDRVLDRLDSAIIHRFFAMILKYRQNPCTIVLTGLNPLHFLDYTDRIGWIVNGKPSQFMTLTTIRSQFQKSRINISYDNQSAKGQVATFDFSDEHKAEWLEFMKGHHLLNIETESHLDLEAIHQAIGGSI